MCFGGLPRAGSRDWPANLEPGMGMLLPDETYEERSSFNSISNTTTEDLFDDIDEYEAAKALAVLQKCDDFLKKYGIRPEFFCKHRERLALQSWLLQKSKLSSEVWADSPMLGKDFDITKSWLRQDSVLVASRESKE
ncbi:hypothetical protein M0802_013314 [Mischocyttarus mexicanus]|nr:hypothetical protein M0802_013314 [Mischocyttarus mexicanus]